MSKLTDKKRVCDMAIRLAAIEKAITKAKRPSDIEQEIVWRLFGTISYLTKSTETNPEEIKHAEWLISEVEDLLGKRIKPV